MNKTYRLIWCDRTQTWVPIPEVSKSRGSMGSSVVGATKGGTLEATGRVGRAGLLVSTALALILAVGGQGVAGQPPAPNQLPTGGQVSAGAASISQSGNTMNITQSSQRAAINWSSFNIGSGATVNFLQPNSSAVALNRIQGNSASQIFGHLNANGQVFITNPNGVYFAPGASVDVGSFLATTHTITDADFMAGNNTFTRNGATGSVVNDGTITAGLGGYIALLAPEVRNNGVVVAQMGTVALAAGEAYQLQFGSNNALSNIIVTPATIAALVQNGNAVQAPGGLIILSAQAADRLQGGVINTSGTLEASGITSNGGVIKLSASDKIQVSGTIAADAAANSAGNGGTVSIIANLANAGSNTQVDGTISARGGTLGGDGGFIETSGGKLSIGSGTRVNTSAPLGVAGTWLLDPDGFTIASSGGDMTGATLSSNLGSGNVAIASTSGSGSTGNINVKDTVSWTAHTLTLTATNNIDINAVMTAGATDDTGNANTYAALILNTGASGKVVTGGTTSGFTGRVDFVKANGTTTRAGAGFLHINGANYTVLDGMAAFDNGTMESMTNTNPGGAGKYALGGNLDASTYTRSGSVDPNGGWVENNAAGYVLDGLGHTISNLTINPTWAYEGLIGTNYGTIRNLGISNLNMTSSHSSLGFVGVNRSGGLIDNVKVTGTNSITAQSGNYGHGIIAGWNYGTVSNSTLHGTISLDVDIGGGAVGQNLVGGLVSNITSDATVQSPRSSASANYGYNTILGGIIGKNAGTATWLINSGNVTILGSRGANQSPGVITGSDGIGGLVGVNGFYGNAHNSAIFENSTFSGQVHAGMGSAAVGGLAGANFAIVRNSASSGGIQSDTHSYGVGGAVGFSAGGQYGTATISNVTVSGTVTSSLARGVGGLVGVAGDGTNFPSSIDSSSSSASVTVTGAFSLDVGGLVGHNYAGSISNSHATGNVSGGFFVGGLAGSNQYGAISSSYSTGNVSGSSYVGGLVGYGKSVNASPATIANSWARSNVTGTGSYVGGLVGNVGDSIVTNSFYDLDSVTVTVGGSTNHGITNTSNASASTGVDGKGVTPYALYTRQFNDWLNNNKTLNIASYFDLATGSYSAGSLKVTNSSNDLTLQNNIRNLLGFVYAYTDSIQIMNNLTLQTGFWLPYFKGPNIASGTGNQIQISGLNVTQPMNDNIGLIGILGEHSMISNLQVSGSVSGGNNVGGVVGNGLYGSGLTNVSANVTVTGSACLSHNCNTYSNVGGLVGYGTYMAISNSSSTGNVSGQNNVGGLMGYGTNGTSIMSSHASGNVTGSSYASGYGGTGAGGLVGKLYGGGVIGNSHATGVVQGAYSVGGLVGSVSGSTGTSISGSYAKGNVTGQSSVGGLVGYNAYGTISTSYLNGGISPVTVTGVEWVGGLVGSSRYGHLNGDANQTVIANVLGGQYVGGLVGVSQGDAISGFVVGASNGSNTVTGVQSSGYVEYMGGAIGSANNSTITNLTSRMTVIATDTNASSIFYVGGLVGYQYGGSITGSHTEAGSVSAGHGNSLTASVGGLVGQMMSGASISRSWSSISVTATGTFGSLTDVGGLVGNAGSQGGTLSEVFASGGVTASDGAIGVGGLIGTLGDGSSIVTLHDAYAQGSVNGGGSNTTKVGGLIGYAYGADIQRVYARGAVSGGDPGSTGGLIGTASGGSTVADAFWDTQTSGQTASPGGGTGNTTADMNTMSTFTNFDMNTQQSPTIWKFAAAENSSYPQLCFVAGSCTTNQGGSSSSSSSSSGSSSSGSSSGSSSSGSSSGSSSSGSSSGSSSSGSSSGSSSSGSSSGSSSSGSSSGSSSSGSSSGSSSSGSSSGSSSSGSSSGSSSSGSSSGSSSSGGNTPPNPPPLPPSSSGSSSGSSGSSSGSTYVPPPPPPPSNPVPPPAAPLGNAPSSGGGNTSSSGGGNTSSSGAGSSGSTNPFGSSSSSSGGSNSSGPSSSGGQSSGGSNPNGSSSSGGQSSGGEQGPSSSGGQSPGGEQSSSSGSSSSGSSSSSESSSGTAKPEAQNAVASGQNGSTANGGNAGSTIVTSTGISITLVQPPSVQQSGAIAVTVPKGMAASGSGFSFALPTQVVQVEGGAAPVQVTTTGGTPLPAWLHYSPDSHTIVATAVPDGGLPIQVVVTVNGASSTIVISEGAQ